MPCKRFRTEHIVTTLRQAEVELGRGLHVQVVRTSADRWFRSPICTRRRAPWTPDLQVTVAMTSSLNLGNGRRRHLRSLYNMVEDQIIPAIQRGYGVEEGTKGYNRPMLTGSRDGLLRKIQPLSIHGQVSWDVYYTDADDPEGQVATARVGPESMDRSLKPGDRIRLHFVLNTVTDITRVDEPAA